VGKSSLFNCLLQSDRSIVTEHPGTTRDVVREMLHVGGLALVLEDTAGLRAASSDPIERLGIERSRRSHAEADIVLHVLDASRPLQPEEFAALATLDPEAALVVVNKIDLLDASRGAALERAPAAWLAAQAPGGETLPHALRCLGVSASTGAGVPAIATALGELGALRRLALQNDAVVAIGLRHREVLLRAGDALGDFAADAAAAEPAEILAVSLRGAIAALGEVAGEDVTEEVLARIFARFCIGK
jgi:tRNA modification GTPase